MKTLLSFFTILYFTIYCGCSLSLVSPSYSNTNNSGQVALKISSDSIPRNVVKVTAILSQSGKDSLISSVEPLSSSSASLNFSNVSVGTWHLKVEALDQDNLIEYSGETDLQVNAGIITQVNLTLIPTGQGKGSIYIFVNWGQSNSIWTDYQFNPIMSPKNNYWDYDGVWQCRIIYDDGVYKMWFMGLAANGVGHIGYAESSDAITWVRQYSDPVLSPGNYGDWDANCVSPGAIIRENGIYKMYYNGWADQNSPWSIGLATSNDGIHWTKYANNPILSGTSGWEFQIGANSILKVNNTYYLYYSGRNLPIYKIGLATSSDGIHWTKYSGNPILVPTEPWESSGTFFPSAIIDNGNFKMVYSNANPNNAIGMATSNDGIHWTKDISNPIFVMQNTSNNWGIGGISYPCFMKINNEYRIYYSGRLPNSAIYKIGFFSQAIN